MKKSLVLVAMVVFLMVQVISPAFAETAPVHNVTVIVNSPYVADAQVYLTGDFNGWQANATPMKPYGYSYSGYSGQWSVTVPMTEGKQSFKFTLGSNQTFEKGAKFEEISNRTIVVGDTDVTTEQTVLNYHGVINFEVNVPSDTMSKTYRVYLATSTKNWFPNSYMMFPKDGSNDVWQTKILVKPGSSMQYKYTLGTWNGVEKSATGKEINNRSFVAKGLTISKNDIVAKWNEVKK